MFGVNLYSERKRRAEMAGKKEVYKYDEIPKEFRAQVIHIWTSRIGGWKNLGGWAELYKEEEHPPENSFWIQVCNILAKEYGHLRIGQGENEWEKMQDFLLNASTDRVLDVVELTFRVLRPDILREKFQIIKNFSHEDAIEDLNNRFEQWSLGYAFVNGKVIRKDSQFVHKEFVVKALKLLNESGFEGASDEFLKGHKHYKDQRYKEAVNEVLKAFESTMKTICKQKNWKYKENDTSKKLIEIMFENKIIEPSLQSHFNALKSTLEGLPTIRNQKAAHGQGESKVELPKHLAQYALNLAATNILFLVEASKS